MEKLYNKDFVTIILSVQLFHGFQYTISKEKFKSMKLNDMIKEIKIELKKFFTKPYDFYILREKVDMLNLHYHGLNIYEDGINKGILYFCDHKD